MEMAELEWVINASSDSSVLKTRQSDRNLLCIRSEAVVELPMSELVKLLTDVSKRGLYDKNFDKGTVVAKMSMDTCVTHTVLKKVMVVGPRDLYTIQKCQQIATNCMVIAS